MFGWELIKAIEEKRIKNCYIAVYKNHNYITCLRVKKNLQPNNDFYPGMLASSKYKFIKLDVDAVNIVKDIVEKVWELVKECYKIK